MGYATCSDLDVRFTPKIPSSTSGAYFDLLIRVNISELTYHSRAAAAQPIKPSQHRRVNMHHTDILTTAARTLNERGEEYGDASVCFDNIARIAAFAGQFATQGQPYTSAPMDKDMARIVDIVRPKTAE